MMHGRVVVLTAIAFWLLAPTTARSQEASSRELAAMTSDSTAWQRVMVYVVGALSAQLVATASDPTPQPWRLEFPSDEPQQQLLRTQLRTIVRARQVMPADTLVRSLELGKLVIANDTARVEVKFQEARKCPATSRSTGFGWTTTVLVPREPRQKFWGSAFARTTIAGELIAC